MLTEQQLASTTVYSGDIVGMRQIRPLPCWDFLPSKRDRKQTNTLYKMIQKWEMMRVIKKQQQQPQLIKRIESAMRWGWSAVLGKMVRECLS